MSLEATTNAIEDHLIDAISFKLAPGASYVTDRRSVSFFPQGSNIYKPQTGTKVIKIALTGTGEWLDPSTLQLQFKLENTGGANKSPICSWTATHIFPQSSAYVWRYRGRRH